MRLLIGELIEEKGIKKQYISKQLGVSRDTLTNWINGKSYPRLDQAVHLAEILGCNLYDLFEQKNNPGN